MTTKSCGDCSLCCLLPQIAALDKPANTWCQNCTKTQGCGIYDHRPDVCRTFQCMWLWNADMPEELKPSRSKVYLTPSPNNDAMQVYVHPHYKDAWRKPKVAALIDSFRNRGLHVIVIHGDGDRTFLNAPGQPLPPEIQNMVVEEKPYV